MEETLAVAACMRGVEVVATSMLLTTADDDAGDDDDVDG
jgi:hypothetical protein